MNKENKEYITALIEKKPSKDDPKEIEITKKIRDKVFREDWAKKAFSDIDVIQKNYFKDMINNLSDSNYVHQQTQDVLSMISGLLRSKIVENEEYLEKLSKGKPVLLNINHFGAYKLLGFNPKEELGVDIVGYDWMYPFPMYFSALKPVSDKIKNNLYYVSDDFPQIFGEIHREAGFIHVPPQKIVQSGRTAVLQSQIEELLKNHPNAAIVNYPEGGSSGKYNGLGPYDLENFSTGGYLIAANLGIPILPVAQYFDKDEGIQLKLFEPFIPKITNCEGYKKYAFDNYIQMQEWLDKRKDA